MKDRFILKVLTFLTIIFISYNLNLKQSASDILATTAGRGVGIIRTQALGGYIVGRSEQGSQSALSSLGRSGLSTAGGEVQTNVSGPASSEGATTSDTGVTFQGNEERGNFDTSGASNVNASGGAGSINTTTAGESALTQPGASVVSGANTSTGIDVTGNAAGSSDTSSTGNTTITPGAVSGTGTTGSGSALDVGSGGAGRSTTDIAGRSEASTPGISGGSSTTGITDVSIHGPGTAATASEGATSVDIARTGHPPNIITCTCP